jgi:hypothetical protein
MFKNGAYRVFAPAVLLAFFAAVAFGQTSSQLTGTITDTSGAVIVGAQVSVRNVDTGAERSTTTNELGHYTLPFLSPGNYVVSVQQQGFRTVSRDNVRLEVNQTARIDFNLEVGAVTETVEVTGAAPLLESDSSSIGQVIDTKPITDLPLNGRNFVSLAILSPGVTGVGFGARGTIMSGTRPDDLRPGSEIFSNGNREGANNFLMDGVDNNERLTLSITLRPSVEAVQEFKIQTNLFAAEQGRNPGATVNVVTKSGTNELHGSLYEFLRNDKLDAREYFARADAPTPAFRQNQFGGTIGGPIKRNKLFFFGAYEGFRKRRENTAVNSVPTAAMRVGDYSAVRDVFDPFTTHADASKSTGFARDRFPNRMIPQSSFDSVMSRVVQAYPLPQSSGLANNHVSNPKEKQRWNQGDVRVDFNANEKNIIFGRYSRQDTVTTRPSTFLPTVIPGMTDPVTLGNEDTFAGDSDLVAYNAVATWVRTFTPTFLMDARMGFNRFALNFVQEGATPGARLGEALGVRNSNQGPASDGIPIFSPAGYTGIGQTRSLPIIRIENTFHPNVNFTNIRGAHTIKFGFDLRRRQLTQFQTNRGNGRFNFSRTFSNDPNATANTGDSIASLLMGTASTIEQDFTLVSPGIRGSEFGYYVQDDWRVSDRLTLNVGLRYEYFTRWSEVANRWTNFDVVTGKLLIAGFNTDDNTGVLRDLNNFAPRLGFAYRLRSSTILRGGYGIFYNTTGSESVVMRRHRQLPFGPINVVDINQFDSTPQLVEDGLAPIPNLDFNEVANNPVGSMLAVAPDFAAGYAQQFNFQIQHEVAQTVFKVGYVGNLSRRIDQTYDFNQPEPGPGAPAPRRPLNSIAPGVVGVTYNVTDGNATYHALQVSAERRFNRNWGFLGSYSWSHAIDNTANAFGGADNGPIPQDRRDRSADRGNSGFDMRHRLIFATNYILPIGRGQRWDLGNSLANNLLGGWQMNLIWTAQTGLPYTPVLATSVSNAGGSRPQRLKTGTLDDPDPRLWFDTSFNRADAAWGVPANFTFGNSGRNILFGPGRINVDYSLFKDFAVNERWKVQFRAEFFNLFNTPQFDLPNTGIGTPNAGTITRIVGNPRQVQFGLRLAF